MGVFILLGAAVAAACLASGFLLGRRTAASAPAAAPTAALSTDAQVGTRLGVRPHFLFNALNTASSLVVSDARAASRLLVLISDLLRRALEDGGAPVTLARELETLGYYVEIEKLRFGGRLRVAVEVPDPLLGAGLPHMVLQPLVESAIRHTVEARRSGGQVRVWGRAEGACLVLGIEDDGHSPATHPERVSDPGIALVRSRLGGLQEPSASLSIGDSADGGARLLLRLPLREAV